MKLATGTTDKPSRTTVWAAVPKNALKSGQTRETLFQALVMVFPDTIHCNLFDVNPGTKPYKFLKEGGFLHHKLIEWFLGPLQYLSQN